jgi:hypothetical protein
MFATYLKQEEYASLTAANSVQGSEDKVLSSALAALELEEEQYDLAAWSQAAVIAQALLLQPV